ncbi:hypothetical protein [Aliivibrio fischeri]|uniref:hypothetical protein n=1 Tax=Aliivibrio fischeri TaxID=668 RepID=UPI0007C5096E|nr:hypothetical protein [Aliivibrio fischeri]
MDISISTKNSRMYEVAKISNDDDTILFFVYNNGCKGEDKYGRYTLICNDGVLLEDENGSLEKATIKEAAKHISDKPIYAELILNNLLNMVPLSETEDPLTVNNKELLIDEVMKQIKSDIESNDLTALAELLLLVPSHNLKNFLL